MEPQSSLFSTPWVLSICYVMIEISPRRWGSAILHIPMMPEPDETVATTSQITSPPFFVRTTCLALTPSGTLAWQSLHCNLDPVSS
ncbi:hypothetical protein JAAARDRAFT_29855 [Jaapia argillacea MUCL 33604]|uniref:Uncharacterized protein n=1 Tax=Jaapia argillacea MUCL 33604 TaxID=933084 RepID=A0A067QA07_9AGAM|nr:hypothetical protein JAAARDRAFT_29855 [Jaapia argillacea MUCL 33604]